tara:strand:+ start:637 stop:1527 length:891 start_codon:yes stop_codon:yes gene_type:complete
MNWDQFLSLIRHSNDSDTTYFGSKVTAETLGPLLVAMANTRGGNIVIGFDKRNYHLLGSEIDPTFIRSIVDIQCYPKPNVSIECCEKNDKQILIVSVKASPLKPYYFNNKCYVLNSDKSSLSVLEKDVLQDDRANSKWTRDVSNDQQALLDRNNNQIDQDDKKAHSQEQLQDISDITDELIQLQNEDDDPEAALAFKPVTVKSEQVLGNNETQLSMTDFEEKPLTKRQEEALLYLEKNRFIKNKMYRSLFSVSHKTAHLELVDLVQRQLIVSQGSGRSTCYIIDETCKTLVDLVRH